MTTPVFQPSLQQGATVSFSGLCTFVDAMVNIPRTSVPVPTVDVTNLGTTGQRKRISGEVADPKPFTVQAQHCGETGLPAVGGVYLVTITAPLGPGQTAAESWAGSCIVTDVRSPEFKSDSPALQTIEIELQPNGGAQGGSQWARTAATGGGTTTTTTACPTTTTTTAAP